MKKGASPAPRGRPRAFDRDAALDIATRLFWEKGYDATSISDLTEAMGIGAPSLYAAFGSKDELYKAALASYGSRYGGIVWDDFRAADTAREAVKAYLINSASALTGCVLDLPRGCMATLARVDCKEHPELAELLRSNRAIGFAQLEERIRKAAADGELPAAAVAQLATFTQMVQSGMSVLARDGATRAELESAVEVALAGWDAIASPGASRSARASGGAAPDRARRRSPATG